MLYLAHRGCWRPNGAENSIVSFNHVINQLSDDLHGFECDFRQIDDSDSTSWVIHHDSLAHYDQDIPRLKDFLVWLNFIVSEGVSFANQGLIINIEIKHGTVDGIDFLIKKISELTFIYKLDIFYSSFDYKIINIIKLFTNNVAGLITRLEDIDKLRSFNELRLVSVGHHNFSDSIFIQLKSLGFPIGVYFNSYNDYKENVDTYEKKFPVNIIFSEPYGNKY